MIAAESIGGAAPWTCKEAGLALGVCPTRAPETVRRVAERIRSAAMAEPRRWAASGRPDRIARAMSSFLTAAGRLAAADPETFSAWVRELVETQMTTRRNVE